MVLNLYELSAQEQGRFWSYQSCIYVNLREGSELLLVEEQSDFVQKSKYTIQGWEMLLAEEQPLDLLVSRQVRLGRQPSAWGLQP